MAAHARQPDPFSAAAPARLEAVFLPRSRGRVHWQRQGQRTLRVRRQGLDRYHQCSRARRPVRAARQNAAYDGHTLGVVIEDTERLTGCELERAYVDKV